MRDFRKLEIWKRSFGLVVKVYQLTNQLPTKEQFGLTSQVNRAAVSIPSNIAEGCGRSSNADLNRFIDMAVGSSFEVETQLMLIKEIYGTAGTLELLSEINELQKMMNSFKTYLKDRG